MKKLLLLLAICAVPALPQCGPLAINPITGELNCTGPSGTGVTISGDVTGTLAASTVVKINGTSLAGLATGLLKNTTATGVPVIATPGVDYALPSENIPGYSPNQILAGCGVEYVSGLTYNVGACVYTINGVTYTTAITSVTATADGSFPRISAIIVDTSSVASVLDGTPAASPASPAIDPATQLPLVLVYIATNGTTPTNTTLVSIYEEDTEWTSAVSANVNAASTSNPFRGTKDIEFTTAVRTNNVTLTKPTAGTELLTNYNNLVFYIRSKAAWTNRQVAVSWLSGATVVGSAVTIADGQFGFSSSVTSIYQQIVIPVALFGTGGTSVTTLKFAVIGNGGSQTIGFYLDAISLQGGISQLTGALVNVNTIGSALYCADAGANDTYACNLNPLPTASYVIGNHYLFKANTVNTGAATINFNAIGAITIKKVTGGITTTLADGDICAGQIVEIAYDGTNMQMLSPTCAAGGAAQIHYIGFSIGDGINVIPTGSAFTFPSVSYSCTIDRYDITASVSGSITIDVWKAAGAIPTSGDKISASAPITLSTAQFSQNGSRTGWGNTVTSGDIFGFSVATVTTITHVDGVIRCQ